MFRVTSHGFVQMLQNVQELKLNKLRYLDMQFQQDGTTAHTARRSMKVLSEHLISLHVHSEFQWHARLPDLHFSDFISLRPSKT